MHGGYLTVGEFIYKVSGRTKFFVPITKNDSIDINGLSSLDVQNVGAYPLILANKWTMLPGASKSFSVEDLHSLQDCEKIDVQFIKELNGTPIDPVPNPLYPGLCRFEASGIITGLTNKCHVSKFSE